MTWHGRLHRVFTSERHGRAGHGTFFNGLHLEEGEKNMVQSTRRILLAAAVGLFVVPLVLRADNSAPGEKLVYIKPAGVADKTRAARGPSRGGDVKGVPADLTLMILCPDHTGLTVQELPSLFWYMNKPVTGRKCRLSITREEDPEPLMEKDIDAEQAVGI